MTNNFLQRSQLSVSNYSYFWGLYAICVSEWLLIFLLHTQSHTKQVFIRHLSPSFLHLQLFPFMHVVGFFLFKPVSSTLPLAIFSFFDYCFSMSRHLPYSLTLPAIRRNCSDAVLYVCSQTISRLIEWGALDLHIMNGTLNHIQRSH